MSSSHTVESESLPTNPSPATLAPSSADKILCPHCRRTANNGIKCQGICVADSDY